MLPTFTTTSVPPIPLHIRWMIKHDIEEVLAIEQASFVDPWTEQTFCAALRERNCIGMICEINGPHSSSQIVGFMIYELHKNYLRLASMAVDPEWRGIGVGSAMLTKIISNLDSHRRSRLVVEVRERDLGVQLFFKAHGFLAVDVLRNWFADDGQDAYRMVYRVKADMPAAVSVE